MRSISPRVPLLGSAAIRAPCAIAPGVAFVTGPSWSLPETSEPQRGASGSSGSAGSTSLPK